MGVWGWWTQINGIVGQGVGICVHHCALGGVPRLYRHGASQQSGSIRRLGEGVGIISVGAIVGSRVVIRETSTCTMGNGQGQL